ncbi:hypothetical protein X975_23153, partial [Stegodyphus mimosarum]
MNFTFGFITSRDTGTGRGDSPAGISRAVSVKLVAKTFSSIDVFELLGKLIDGLEGKMFVFTDRRLNHQMFFCLALKILEELISKGLSQKFYSSKDLLYFPKTKNCQHKIGLF